MSSLVALEGLEFYAHHGVFAEENRLGTRFTVDVWLHFPFAPAAQSDSLQHTVDYTRVYALVKARMERPANLLETLAVDLAESIGQHFGPVQRVQVRVSKHHPPIQGLCGRTYAEHHWHRP